MLIVEAYRNLLETSASIAKRFHMSDTYVHEIFDIPDQSLAFLQYRFTDIHGEEIDMKEEIEIK